jgi:predicted dienelactone hydrolase
VGHKELSIEVSILKKIPLGVWYPALPQGDKTKFLGIGGFGLVEGDSYEEAPVDTAGLYPLVMFSHGNKGINYQSFTIYEYLVSHGFIVAAPDHDGNTLMDNPSDEEVADIAYNRPANIMEAMQVLIDDGFLNGVMDLANAGIMGHSFGGYTALVLAGGQVDVDAANARCQAGIEADVFCPYIVYWPAGETVTRPPEADGVFKACLALAPGGYAAFGDEGLQTVDMPVFLAGGTLDEYTKNDIDPIFNALPVEKYKLIIEKAGHMSFTDICHIPGVQFIPTLGDLCDDTHIELDRCFEITNTFVVAFFRHHLLHDRAMIPFLTPQFAVKYPEATLTVGN